MKSARRTVLFWDEHVFYHENMGQDVRYEFNTCWDCGERMLLWKRHFQTGSEVLMIPYHEYVCTICGQRKIVMQ